MTCEYLHETTREPKVFYQSDLGQVYPDLLSALQNSDRTYRVGFKDTAGNFIGRATLPATGIINTYIKNQYLKPSKGPNDTYQAVDSIAADILEESLILENIDGYERTGDSFRFGDFKLKVEDLDSKEAKGMLLAYDTLRSIRARNDIKQEAPKYDDSQLKTMIQDFMLKMGFTFQSVKNLEHKGVSPEAMINFSEKLIQFAEGRDTLENLSEEFSHFLVESFDQSMIDRMLLSVHNTQEYAKYAQQYKDMYSRQISDPQLLEKAVRKEILGKLLSASLQRNFEQENRNATELTLIQRLRDMLKGLIDFIRRNLTNDLRFKIDDLSKDVLKRLRNNTLQERLNPLSDVTIDVMYRARELDPVRYRNFVNSLTFEQQLAGGTDTRLADIHSLVASALLGAESTLINLKDAVSKGQTPSNSVIATIRRLEDLQSFVNTIGYRVSLMTEGDYENMTDIAILNPAEVLHSLNSFKRDIAEKVDMFNKSMGEISGTYNGGAVTSEELLRELEDSLGKNNLDLDRDKRFGDETNGVALAKYAVNKEQEDTNWFWYKFGHISKSSNLFVAVAGALSGKMHDEQLRLMDHGIKRLIKPLEQYKDYLPDIFRNGRFRNGVNEDALLDKQHRYTFDLLMEVHNGSYEYAPGKAITTYDEFLEALEDPKYTVEHDDPRNVYKYRLLDRVYYNRKDWLTDEEKEADKRWWQDLIDVAGTSDVEMLVDMQYVRDLIDQSLGKGVDLKTRRDRQNPFDSLGGLKQGLVLLTKQQALSIQYQVTSGKAPTGFEYFDIKDVVSDNPNMTFAELDYNDYVFWLNDYAGEAGTTAYMYMRHNRKLKESSNITNVRDNMVRNFESSYREQVEIADAKGLKGVERRNYLTNWVNENVLFDNNDDYWENVGVQSMDYDGLIQAIISTHGSAHADIDTINDVREQVTKLSMRKKYVMKKLKSKIDYKEIDLSLMSPNDRSTIMQIENEIASQRKRIYHIFEEYNIPAFKSGGKYSPKVRLNKAAAQMLKAEVGSDLYNASIDSLERFFFSQDNSKMERSTYNRIRRDILAGNAEQSLKDFATEQGFDSTDPDGLTRALLLQKASSWLKRYDSSESYEKFTEMLSDGHLDIEKTMDAFFKKPDSAFDFYDDTGNKHSLDFMLLIPSFRFNSKFRPDKKHLLMKYQMAGTRIEKKKILDDLNELDRVRDAYKEDMSDIFNDSNKTEAFWMAWDIQVERLLHDFSDESSLLRKHISIAPQVRRTNYERLQNIFSGKFDATSLKDWAMEAYAFREDDYENAYKDSVVPRYGYRMLTNQERSDDYYHGLVWGLKNAYTRHSRTKYLPQVQKALRGIETQYFEGGKDPKTTNYYKMLSEHIDYAYYGKSQSFQKEFVIPFSKWGMGSDIKLDMGKILLALRGFSVKAALMFSPLTSINNFFSGVTQNTVMAFAGHDIYKKSNARATSILGGNITPAIGDIGEFDPKAKLNLIMYKFGYHDLEQRYQDARYNKALRILPELGFSLMALTNYPLEMQSMLSKLMEYRLVDGQFMDYKTFKRRQKISDPSLTKSEINSRFDEYENKSLYDFLDSDTAEVDLNRLMAEGYNGNIEDDIAAIRASIRDITERTTMEIRGINEAEGLRSPVFSFLTSMKKWMILSASAMTARERFSYDSMSEEKGLYRTLGKIPELVVRAVKERQGFNEVFDSLPEIDQVNARRALVSGALVTTAFALAYMLKGLADDDDERDNYMLQLATLVAIRNLNEVSSANIQLGQAFLESVKAPVMAADTLGSITKMMNVSNIGDEVSQGKYKGMDKWVSDVIKGTWLKNLYNVGVIQGGDYSPSEVLFQTRNSYLHFNTNESLYTILEYLPEKPKE